MRYFLTEMCISLSRVQTGRFLNQRVRKENRGRVGIGRLLRQMSGSGEVLHKKREMGNPGSRGLKII
jgi:hypothetical protein